ncbi:MAG TPA: DUF6452 family protein [Arachidicoccus sp.]|nr:DUF6452 family protein [Arachidicoccus sp.]
MNKDLKLFIILITGLFMLAACEKEKPDCYQSNSVMAYLQFKSKDTIHIDSLRNDTLIDTLIVSYRDTSLATPLLKSLDQPKTFLSYGNITISYLGVPLNPGTDSIRYALQYDTTIADYDTITYYYQTTTHFISNNCGFTNYFFIDSIHVTGNFIDSFALVKNEVTSEASTRNIYLYFFRQ